MRSSCWDASEFDGLFAGIAYLLVGFCCCVVIISEYELYECNIFCCRSNDHRQYPRSMISRRGHWFEAMNMLRTGIVAHDVAEILDRASSILGQ